MKGFFKSIIPAVLTLVIASCGGGGGGSTGGGNNGGNNPPPPPTYLKVTSVTPQNGQTNVRFDAPIHLNFSEKVDATTFVNTDAKIGSLMLEKGLAVLKKDDFTELSDTEVKNLSLDDLATGDYIVTSNPEDTQSNDPVVGFDINHSSQARTLVLTTLTAKEIVFSHRELKETGLFEQNMIVIKNQDGEALKGRLVSDLVLKRVEFRPYGYLDYENTYTITVNKNLTSTANHSLQQAYTSSFTVEDLPPVEYVSNSPTGVDNNPLNDIVIEVNFNLDSDVDLSYAIQVFEVVNENNETREDIQVTSKILSQNKREILISRDGYWKHNAKYRVKVTGEYLTGTSGNSGPLSLATKDLDWTFETSAPKLIYKYPTLTDGERVVETKFYVGFNFPVNPSELKNKISLIDENGTPYDFDVTNSTQMVGRYILTPIVKLPYNETMTVNVASGVQSSLNAAVKTTSATSFQFKTEKKRVETLDPYDGERGVLATTNINIDFNFPIEVDPTSYIKLTQIHDGITTPLDYQYSLSNGGKSIQLRPMYEGSDYDFLFNANVYVQILEGVAGGDLAGMEDLSYQFTIENQELVISSSNPYDGAAIIPVNETSVSVTFNYEIFDDSSIASPIYIEYNCDGFAGTIEDGTYTISGKTIYFDPSYSSLPDDGYFGSACDHTIVVDPRVSGMAGQLFESDSDNTTEFSTDWLDIDEIRVEYAYGDRIRVDSEFEIDFSHDIAYGFDDSNFEFVPTYSDVEQPYVDSSRWGDEITVTPSNYYGSQQDLFFGEEYTLWVNTDPEYSYEDPIRSTSGERLVSDYYFTFTTENMPLDVDYYSPTGDYVDVDSNVYLNMNYYHYDQGFPRHENIYFDISAYYYNADTEQYETYYYDSSEYDVEYIFDDIDVYFYDYLIYDADYEVTAYFVFDDGEEVSFSWTFTTEAEPYGATSTASAKGSAKASKATKSAKAAPSSLSKAQKKSLKEKQKTMIAALSKKFKKNAKFERNAKRVESKAKMLKRASGSSASKLNRQKLKEQNKASKLSRKATKARI
jgi:hypothetical protein